MSEQPLRPTGWRGRAHDLLDQVLDLEDDDAKRGLPKLQGGIAKAWREAYGGGCGRPAAGMIETLNGPKPICPEHIPAAERYGYTLHSKGGNES